MMSFVICDPVLCIKSCTELLDYMLLISSYFGLTRFNYFVRVKPLYFMSSWPYLNTTYNNLNVLINIEMMMTCLFLYLKIFRKEAEVESWCSSLTVPDFSNNCTIAKICKGFCFCPCSSLSYHF